MNKETEIPQYIKHEAEKFADSKVTTSEECWDKIDQIEWEKAYNFFISGAMFDKDNWVKFLEWTTTQKDFQFDGDKWSENTGHDDFAEYTTVEFFEYWKESIQ